MAEHAIGTFEVKLTPEEDKTGEAIVGRMIIDKQFEGDIEGTSKGLMVMTGRRSLVQLVMSHSRKLPAQSKDRAGVFICNTMAS